jgi:hypothetical protein
MKTETQKQYRIEDLFETIRQQGPLFDDIELSVTSLWDDKNGCYRYCRMVRVVRNQPITLWIHTCKGELSHVIYSVNGNDEYIDASQFVWGYPTEFGLRKMVNEFISEVAG